MKKILLAGAALAALAAPASAADLAARPAFKAPVAVPIVYNWSGFYIGAHVGGAWGDKDWTEIPAAGAPIARGSHDISGFLAGGQAGVNFQSGNWVFGIEGQLSWTNADGSHVCVAGLAVCNTDVNWLGTVAGRIGYAWDRVMVYGKGGFAFADEKYFVTALPGGALVGTTSDDTRTGWMLGAGVEWALWDNWSAKIEYNYMDFGRDRFAVANVPGPGTLVNVDIDQQVHVVKLGVNYRFNWGAPVVARY